MSVSTARSLNTEPAHCLQVPHEFDFVAEAAASERIAACLAKAETTAESPIQLVHIPRVVPHLSRRCVLTTDFVRGVPISLLSAAPRSIRVCAAKAVVAAYCHMIFGAGELHTDPHPGNLLATSADGRAVEVALLDFGQFKTLTVVAQRQYAELVVALAAREGDGIRAAMANAGVVIEGCSDAFLATAGVILFDTRMDFPEATLSPGGASAAEAR
jgi:predicted unusual protein kinase regulating ubiquinone biosynthesis (AarF/ABC1/UbiB family)